MNASLASDPQVRMRGIGGTDMAAIVGVSPYRTAYDVYLEKIGEPTPELDLGERVIWGNILEEPIAQEAARRLDVKIQRVNRTLVHRDHPYMIGHIDRRIIGATSLFTRSAMEVKSTSFFNGASAWGDEAENIPEHVLVQVQHYCEVDNLDGIYVPVLIGGQRLEIFPVKRDKAMGAALAQLASEFWHNHVLARIPPSATTVEEVKRRWPQALSLTIEASAEASHALSLYVDAKAREKAAKADATSAADVIASFLEEFDTLTVDGRPALSFKTQSSRRVDLDGLRAAHPALCEQFTRESTTRVMRVLKGFK